MTTCFMPPTNPEAYSEPSQTSKMEFLQSKSIDWFLYDGNFGV